ncbi:MAG: FAD-dependent oxidoreductase [Candidatus Sumerlaeales bacterium]|nr:FAD-dependent oxidoreductase [Candidatus Sumerlaeales bacterium]
MAMGLFTPEMIDNKRFDLIVIGGGHAGCTLASDAAEAGLRTALIEGSSNGLGGAATHETTIPVHNMIADLFTYDHAIVSREQPQAYHKWLVDDLTKKKVTLIKAWGQISAVDEVLMVNTKTGMSEGARHGHNIVIATGTAPALTADLAITDSRIVRIPAAIATIPTHSPRSILVYGCNQTAIECATILAAQKHQVILCSESEVILPDAPQPIQEIALSLLERLGIRLCMDIFSLTLTDTNTDSIVLELESAAYTETVMIHHPIDCGGRRCASENLCSRELGIRVASGDQRIVIDALCRTSAKRIFALGSVTNSEMTPDTAQQSAHALASFLSGETQGCPNLVETPQTQTLWLNEPIAWVGMDCTQALVNGHINAVEGFVNLTNEFSTPQRTGLLSMTIDLATGKILGAYALGHASETLIRLVQSLMRFEINAATLAQGAWDPAITAAVRDALNRGDKQE